MSNRLKSTKPTVAEEKMGVQVTINNLKGIKKLVFDVPMKGAFVITGANGCGKTSLLTVLHC